MNSPGETELVVHNVAPVVEIVLVRSSPESPPEEGSTIQLDVDVDDVGAAENRSYAWRLLRDGVLLDTGEAQQFRFTPTDDGRHEALVTVGDGDPTDPLAGSDRLLVDVQNVKPENLALSAPARVHLGQRLEISGSFADPGADVWFAKLQVALVGGGLGPTTIAVPTTTDPTGAATQKFATSYAFPNPGVYDLSLSVADDEMAEGRSGADGTPTPITVQVEVVAESWQNLANPLDVNQDGWITAEDVLILINEIHRREVAGLPIPASSGDSPPPFVDVSGDGILSALDALILINHLNVHGPVQAPSAPAGGQGNLATGGEGEPPSDHELRDAVFSVPPAQPARSEEQKTEPFFVMDELEDVLSDIACDVGSRYARKVFQG